MKKQIFSANVSVVLCVVVSVLCFSLFGCNAFGNAKEHLSSSKGITFMVIDNDGNPLSGENTERVLAYMKDWTGVDVSFNFVAADQYDDEAKRVLKNTSELPNIMHVTKLTQEIINGAQSDMFWDLNEFIWDSSKYPNLSQANKNVCKSLEVEGKLIGLYKARDIGRYGLSYRKDWAEKFGFSTPQTPEDVYEMMQAFTYDDPDGNGIDDTYGLAMCSYTGPFDIIQTWFGCGNGWVEEAGSILPVHQSAAYKDALDWLRLVYEEGLMPQDWRSRDTKTWQKQVMDGEAGIFIDVMDGGRRIWDNLVSNKVPSVMDSSEYASMDLVGIISGATLATSGYNGFLVFPKANTTRAQVEQALHFVDKMCDDEMLILSSYGIEGLHYDVKDGYIVLNNDMRKKDAKSFSALIQCVVYIPKVLTDSKPALKQNARKIRELEVIKNNERYAVFNPAVSYIANSKTYSSKGAELDAIISEARTRYICGEINEAGLQDAFDKWNKMGGTALLAEVTAQYRADMQSR